MSIGRSTAEAGAMASFRDAMASFPTGVSVVTTMHTDGAPRGMTCSALCSVSMEPPLLLVCLRTASPTLDAIRVRGGFVVNLLKYQARDTARLFASGDTGRFDQVAWRHHPGTAGPCLVDDAHAAVDCQVLRRDEAGDHVVVLGEVVGVRTLSGAAPLLYGLRRYARWPDASSLLDEAR
ncbi:flavin reductase family protein [Saccharomonospora piscinae]|uniref:Flavin reductase n=1 Tax=Saccharomonospora piscinae TaxID=687388 RepID=W5VGI7_SACPI|nr:flavin reductase family protein [Saccharomonospora piscinae]AHH53513.1 flavin reductase [Saccharomonospora piscinae]